MQLNKIFNAEDIEVLFAQWENVTGVKPLLLDSDGSVAIGEGEASEYRDVIKAGIEIVGYLSYAKKEDAEDENEAKAKILYDYLDSSKLFKGTVVKEDRSLMNVPFVIGDKDMEAKFIAEATEAGFINLKGHKTVGGMRASIYNAMPIEGVEKLVEFMKKFEEANS